MATLEQQFTIRNDSNMIDRVEAACVKYADYIAEIMHSNPDTHGYNADMVQWVGRTLATPRVQAVKIMGAIAGNTTISAAYVSGGQSGVPDSDISYVVETRTASIAKY